MAVEGIPCVPGARVLETSRPGGRVTGGEGATMSSRQRALERAQRSIRRRVAGSLAVLLAGTGMALLPAGAAHANYPSFVCTGNTVYAMQQSTGNVYGVKSTDASSTLSAEFGSGNWNALALGGAGSDIWAFDRTNNRVRVARNNHTENTYAVPSNSLASSVVAGAINPDNGIYYYASGGSTWTVFAFNTVTKTAIGQVATISGTGLGGNGDFAFDSSGNLYIVSNDTYSSGSGPAGTLARVNGSLPTTAGSAALGVTVLATTPAGNGQYHSMAFDSSGLLVIGTSSPKIIRVNPVTGAIVDSSTMGYAFTDLASCAQPSTAQAQVDLPEGRHTAGDQFTVTLSGSGLGTSNTGTTTGTDSGVQSDSAEKAGPAVVLPSQTYTITQTAAGSTSLSNYATSWTCKTASGTTVASGTGNSGTFTMPSASGSEVTCTFTNTPQRPAIKLTKTAGALTDTDSNGPDAGDTITYTFTVKNTGNVALNPVTVHDPLFGGSTPNITCPSGSLAPNASVTCTAKTYTLTQGDVDAGRVDNTATTTGTAANGVKVSDTSSTSTPVAAFPAISLKKTAGAINDVDGNGPDAGDTIGYTFKVTNTGNVTLNPVTVHDPLFGSTAPSITCPTGALAPGASVTCSGKTHTLTQADVDAGKRDNTATATGTAPSGAKVTSADSTSTPVARTAAIDLVKTASAINDLDSNGADAGDTITYSFKVTNTGNVTLNPVKVHDPLFGGANPNITCPAGALAPGASVPCSSRTYTLTQANVDAGKLENTATATGTGPSGATVTDAASTLSPIPAGPGLELDKSASAINDLDGNGADAGDTITYSFKVTNTGTVTLNPVTVHDPLFGGANPSIACPTGPLAPGASVTCTSKTYTLTQSDVDAGKVDNTATATGTKPGGGTVSDTDSTSTTIVAGPAILLDKTASAIDDVDGNGADAGDKVTYSFKVTNTGTVTLNPVTVHDPLLGATSPSVTCPVGALAPGTSVTCTSATYTLTQADVDAGKRDNTATATGTAPGGAKVTSSDSTSTTITAVPAIELTKTASAIDDNDGNGPDAGDTITYTFKVENTGTVALDPAMVHDPLFGGASPNVTCPAGPLAPGASVTCSSKTYTLTQGDVDAGKVDNTATATGTAPDGSKVTDPDSTTTPVVAAPAIKLTKTASAIDDNDGNGHDAGDTITYTFKVKNTGAVVLDPVVVSDPLFANPAVTCPAGPLAPGASVTCSTKTYTLTVSDVDNGTVDNTATATGTAPSGATVSDTASTSTPVVPVKADLVVTKSVDKKKPYAGETVTYTVTVANEGGQTAENVKLVDTLPDGVTFVSAAPGACSESGGTVTCEWPTLLGGESKTVTITATVDPVVTGGPDHDHQIDVQKAEVHMDLLPGQERALSVTCPTGYVVTDGSGRIDQVDQGTGTLASVGYVESRATNDTTWQATLRNDATGRAQAKVFAVCVKEVSEVNQAHAHDLQLGDVVTQSVDLSSGAATATLECAPGTVPIRPGYALNGTAEVVTSYPAGDNDWTFALSSGGGDATSGVVSIQCMLDELAEANGHGHDLNLREVTQNVTVPAGEVLEVTLTCPVGYKGIVAGWRLDEGLVNLGNDPRPIIRVFKLFNPTSGPLTADLWLGCLATRTKPGTGNPVVSNTASATTTSPEKTLGNNYGSATFTVDMAPASPSARVAVAGSKVKAPVVCKDDEGCGGVATLVALKTQKVAGKKITKGTVLAEGTYVLESGEKSKVVLKASKKTKKALKKVKKATLKLGNKAKKVTLR